MIADKDTYIEDMAFLMRDAHRRHSQEIRPPAVTWHMAFLRSPSTLKNESGDLNWGRHLNTDPSLSSTQKWYEDIEVFIILVYDLLVQHVEKSIDQNSHVALSNLQDPECQSVCSKKNIEIKSERDLFLFRNKYEYVPNLGRGKVVGCELRVKEGLYVSRYDTAILGGKIDGYSFFMRFEVFGDYFCVTVCMHLDADEESATPLAEAVDSLADILTKRYERVCERDSSAPESEETGIKEKSDVLYNKIWDLFDGRTLSRARKSENFSIFRECKRNDGGAVGRIDDLFENAIFADFRGVILPVDKSADGKDTAFRKGSPKKSNDILKRVSGALSESSNEAVKFVETIFPLIRSTEGETRPKSPFEAAEYTYSLFCGRRYIYGSSFGWENTGRKVQNSRITYVILAFNDEWRQIGRTILRLHTMGTLRLAALFELRKLMIQDELLIRLENELELFYKVRDINTLSEVLIFILNQIKFEEFGKSSDKNVINSLHDRLEKRASCCSKYDRDILNIISVLEKGDGGILRDGRLTEFQYRSALSQLREVLRPLKKHLEHEHPEDTNARGEVKCLLRLIALLLETKDVESFHQTLLDRVRKTLSKMDGGIRRGGTYCARRSHYFYERFKSLCQAMEIEKIPGFQSYGIFVQHRLERSYELIQAISARFTQVSELERHLRARLGEEILIRRQDMISEIQQMADIFAWLFLVPYYAGSVAGAIAEVYGKIYGEHFGAHAEAWVASFFFSMGVFMSWRNTWEYIRRTAERARSRHTDGNGLPWRYKVVLGTALFTILAAAGVIFCVKQWGEHDLAKHTISFIQLSGWYLGLPILAVAMVRRAVLWWTGHSKKSDGSKIFAQSANPE